MTIYNVITNILNILEIKNDMSLDLFIISIFEFFVIKSVF